MEAAAAKSEHRLGTFERVVLTFVLSLLGLQYYAYDVMDRILKMPTIVVNVPASQPLEQQHSAEKLG